MLTIVCVYNNREILEDWLLKSLQHQKNDFELITLDNRNNKFKSAAQALNYGGKKAKNEYIMFVHQDISFESYNFLINIEKELDKLDKLGIAGVAGKNKKLRYVLANIYHGDPPRLAGKIQIDAPKKVQTIDECLMIIPKSVFRKHQFDEKTCDDWHLYGVDYCLDINKVGYNVYVLPLSLYHRSPGYSFSNNYFKILRKLINKHNNDCKIIYTTMGTWNMFIPLYLQKIWKLLWKKIKCLK
jgi:GT2 family glycosyltransferase